MNKTTKGFAWKLLERFGVASAQFVLQIILARLLAPEHYGALSIMIIFTTLANVFVQSGFNTALVQNKDVDEDDYSSVFWVSFIIALILYAVIFFASPLIGLFYNMPEIVTPMRVLGLMILPGSLNSVQVAKISREMNFRKIFFSNIWGVLISGIVGIVIAYNGGGLWALVAQSLLNVCVVCLVMRFTAKLKLRLICNLKRVKVLFGFGWKLLVSSLIDVLYHDLRSLVIGKKYNSGTLGYYNRGKQFPQFITTAVNGAAQSVLLPAMAEHQDDKSKVKEMTRNSIMLSAYILFPMMAGLAAVATPLVSLLLTDKWLPCVPYLQIYCFTYAFWPIHTSNLQAINAIGRSDIFLKLEVLKKSIGVAALVIALLCFDTPLAIAMTGIITALISSFFNAFPNQKLIGYSYFEQMRDILPSLVLSAIMFAAVYALNFLPIANIFILIIQVIVGIVVYFAISFLVKFEPLKIIIETVKNTIKKKTV